MAQNEFDRQAEITKLLLEGVNSSHASHLRCLHEFVETQVRYQAQCHQIMQDLQKDLARYVTVVPIYKSRFNFPQIMLQTMLDGEMKTFYAAKLLLG